MKRANELPRSALAGLNVLVVEDDYLLAQETATTLREYGAEVFGPVPDLERALDLCRRESMHCALLDVNLKGEFAFELANDLLARRIRVIFTTGYDTSFLPSRLRNVPCIQKPLPLRQLIEAVRGEPIARPASHPLPLQQSE